MKKTLLILFSLFYLQASATHIAGGFISVKYNNSFKSQPPYYTYDITVTLFNNCMASQTNFFEDTIKIGVYSLSGNYFISTVPFTNPTIHSVPYFSSSSVCYEWAEYKKTIIVSTDFYVSYARCCRSQNILNLKVDQGMTLISEVTLFNGYCATPKYNLPILAPINKNLNFDMSIADSLIDSTNYSLSPPFQGGDVNDIIPIPKSKPYYNLIYNTGFSQINQLGTSNTLTINKRTGMLSMRLTTIGEYQIGIKAIKYKNGNVITVQNLDISVTSCVNCAPLGISEASTNQEKLIITPNPAINQIEFDINLSDKNELTIYDMNGNVITKESQLNTNKLNIQSLPLGTYYLQIRTKETIKGARFTKL